MTALEQWFESHLPALISGRLVRPRAHPHLAVPLQVTRGQGSLYWLDAHGDAAWILKVFLPAQRPQRHYIETVGSCIPHFAGFRCGWERSVLGSDSLIAGEGSFASQELASWLDGTVLMPLVHGRAWGDILIDIADGQNDLASDDRIALAGELAEAIVLLELAGVSHRDLATTNILIGRPRCAISLIDWDTLYHPTLPFQANTTVGTPGYIAPWIGTDGAQSWCLRADRFALAICIAEILTVRVGIRLCGDGSLFEQASLGHNGDVLSTIEAHLAAISNDLASLFCQAWTASSFDACPSPLEWLDALSVIADERQFSWLTRGESARRWEEALGRLREEGEDVGVEDIVAQYPDLEVILTEGQRTFYAQQIAPRRRLSALRRALAVGEDAAIKRAAEELALPRESLRPSETRQLEQILARESSLSTLRQEVERRPLDDPTLAEAWWRAVRLGACVPQPLTTAALNARRRLLVASRPTISVMSSIDESADPLHDNPDPPDRSCDETSQGQQASLSFLNEALERGMATEIAEAGTMIRATGGRLPPELRDRVTQAEAQVADVAELRTALLTRDLERAALAWARVHTLWPTSLDTADDAAGRNSFRRWGQALRQRKQQEELS